MLKSTARLVAQILLPCVCAVALLSNASFCAAQDEVKAARAERAKQLEKRVNEVRDEVNALRAKWNAASDQAKSNVKAELDVAKNEWNQASDELQTAYEGYVSELNDSMDAAWEKFAAGRDQAKAIAVEELEAEGYGEFLALFDGEPSTGK